VSSVNSVADYLIKVLKVMTKGDNVLTTGDVANICNVAPRTVSKWLDNGLLNGYRIPGSLDRRIPIDGLARFMQAHNIPWPQNYLEKYIKTNPPKPRRKTKSQKTSAMK